MPEVDYGCGISKLATYHSPGPRIGQGNHELC